MVDVPPELPAILHVMRDIGGSMSTKFFVKSYQRPDPRDPDWRNRARNLITEWSWAPVEDQGGVDVVLVGAGSPGHQTEADAVTDAKRCLGAHATRIGGPR